MFTLKVSNKQYNRLFKHCVGVSLQVVETIKRKHQNRSEQILAIKKRLKKLDFYNRFLSHVEPQKLTISSTTKRFNYFRKNIDLFEYAKSFIE